MKKTILIRCMLGIGFLGIFSCAGPHSSTLPKSEQVVVIIENCPIQTSTNKVGHNISQTAYSTIDYIDKDGNLIEYNPCLAGRDTIILPTFHGYAEMMHVYKALEKDYFLLKEGDTVLVSYDADERPMLNSRASEKNTYLYNLPYRVPGARQLKGFHIETVLSDYIFSAAFQYSRDRDIFASPDLDEFFGDIYVNLDSLSQEFDKYKISFKNTIDSLYENQLIDTLYYDYYLHRVLPDERYKPSEVVQSDSLLHFISHYVTAQDYAGGNVPTESFDRMITDTVATPLARNGILKRLINTIIDGDSGWHIYPDDTVSEYVKVYTNITGDSSPKRVIGSKKIEVETFDLPLESEDGVETNLQDILEQHRGSVVYVDFWASWCGPCLQQIPYMKKLHASFPETDVRFLCISLDTDAIEWKKRIEKNADVFKGSYRITNRRNSFLNAIRLDYVPRYLIFDRDGKLVNPDAIQPYHEDLARAQLKRYL